MIGYFRQLLLVALIAGGVAGAVSWLAQMVGTTPLILQAEVYEKAAAEAEVPASAPGEGAAHAHEAFAPADGWQRNLFTLGADLLTGIGFAMAMVAGFAISGGRVDFRRGLLWGAAGFAAFALAPSLGLPPQLPGAAEAPLADRQIWWLLTAAATLIGIGAIAWLRGLKGFAIGAVLIALPHLVGAPQPADHGHGAPDELRLAFVWVALASALVFWMALGGVAGAFYKKFGPKLGA